MRAGFSQQEAGDASVESWQPMAVATLQAEEKFSKGEVLPPSDASRYIALACAFVVLEAVATAPRVSPPSPKLKSLQDGKRPSQKKTSRAARLCESYFACLQASGAASAGRAGCGTHTTLGAHASGRIWFGSVQEALIFSWAWPARNFATVLQHWGLKV